MTATAPRNFDPESTEARDFLIDPAAVKKALKGRAKGAKKGVAPAKAPRGRGKKGEPKAQPATEAARAPEPNGEEEMECGRASPAGENEGDAGEASTDKCKNTRDIFEEA